MSVLGEVAIWLSLGLLIYIVVLVVDGYDPARSPPPAKRKRMPEPKRQEPLVLNSPAPDKPEQVPIHPIAPPAAHPPARRVYEWCRNIVDELGIEHVARSYAPTESPTSAPWVVTAWYDVKRDAEIIRVEFAPAIPFEDVKFAVRRGGEIRPDRTSFRKNSWQLWPDDKWNDRVVYRYEPREETRCFLVDVTVRDTRIDFYHESERERSQMAQKLLTVAEKLPEPAPPASDDFKAYQDLLAELRRERQKLDAAELHADDKKALAAFLDQRTKDATALYLGKRNSIDFFSPRR